MRVNDALSGFIIGAFGAAVVVYASGFRDMPGQAYGPGLMPSLIGGVMHACGLLLMVRGWRERARQPVLTISGWMRSPRLTINLLSVIAALIFYVLMSEVLGFFLTALVILFAMMAWLRGREHLLSSLGVSLVSVVFVQLFFGIALRVPLPQGVLANLMH